mmetsp:Transcript_37686/g.82730  ORF Transcript_37686/g.82730 Transcript_37686/m.82730 type:complete len:514 (+) Transcript_37686:139-1680(+)
METSLCNGRNGADRTIPVVVVESHQHVLEHIHYVLRHRARIHSRQLRRSQAIITKQQGQDDINCRSMKPTQETEHANILPPPISLVHFDSHPDLACPSADVPAAACFQPRKEWQQPTTTTTDCTTSTTKQDHESRNLYEYLDLDRSGIAQWILPLVLSGDLDTVRWVRSSWANQIRDGTYEYRVGAWLSSPAEGEYEVVDIDTIERSERPQSFVDLPREAPVKVDFCHSYYFEDESVVPTEELLLAKQMKLIVSQLDGIHDETKPARLDEVGGETDWVLDICLDYFVCDNPFLKELEEIDEQVAAALLAAAEQAIFSQSKYQQEYKRFQTLMARLLKTCLGMEAFCADLLVADLIGFFESKAVGFDVIDDLLAAVGRSSADPLKLTQSAVGALPSMTLPKDGYASVEDALAGADMQIKSMITHLEAGLIGYKQQPLMVTLARSSDDGFLRMELVEKLQKKVLDAVHSVYCNCNVQHLRPSRVGRDNVNVVASNCTFNLLFDYGEFEGSELLLS